MTEHTPKEREPMDSAWDSVNDFIHKMRTDSDGVSGRYRLRRHTRHRETEAAYRRGWVHALASLHHMTRNGAERDARHQNAALAWYLNYAQRHRARLDLDFDMHQVERAFAAVSNLKADLAEREE